MKVKDERVLETTAGGSAGQYTIAYKLKVYDSERQRASWPVTQWSSDYVSSIKELVTSRFGCSMEQVHLYHEDGSEIINGTLLANGIVTGETLKAVF